MKTGNSSLPFSSAITELSGFFDGFGWARTAAVLSSCTLIIFILVRTYYSLLTGYLLPEEPYYYFQIITNHKPFSSYRPFFHIMFLLFFQGTDSVLQLLVRGALYSAIWAVGSIFVLYKTLRVLDISDKPAALVLLSLPLFPVFTVMAVFFVTETLGIFLALLGILFSVKYFKSNKLVNVLLSAVFFVLAYETREPYLLLALGNFFVLLLLKRQLRGLVVYALVISIIVPVPTGIHPIAFTVPASNFVFVTFPNFLGNLYSLAVQTGTSSISSSAGATTSISTTSISTTRISTTSIASTSTSVSSSSAASPITVAPTVLPLSFSWNDLVGFFLGLFYGFGPLFVIFIPFSLFLAARKKTRLSLFILLMTLLALGTFFIASDTEITQLPSGIGPWLSDIIRLTSSAVPVLVGFGYFYSKIKPRRLVAVLFVYVVLAAVFVPQLGTVLQSSQNSTGKPIDRLSFDYRAPYYRMYQIAAHSGETLIVGGMSLRGIRVYASMLPNVVLAEIPPTQQDLNSLLNRNWSAIYLYDDYYTILSPSLISVYPAYYQRIVLSHSYDGYSIQALWIDGESYALSLVKRGQ